MEFRYTGAGIALEKELNRYDRFVIDFVTILDEAKIRYVLLSGYVALLFGRSRQTEDIDLVIEDLDKRRFSVLWQELRVKFVCLNTDDAQEAYDRYLQRQTAIRFSRPREYIPNIELKFVHQPLERIALDERISVRLNKQTLHISPLELQIAFKLFLGSDKDIEDARHLHNIFKEHLNKGTLRHYIHELKQEAAARKYLEN